MSEPTPEEMWPEVDPPTTDPGGAVGWVGTAAQAEMNAKAYADEQIPLVAGRMVPRNEDRAPATADGADAPVGTGWNQYDPVTGDLVQMWRWDGAAWVALDMDPAMIPVLDIGSATVGDLIGDRINVTETLSAAVVEAMSVNAKELVVTEGAVLNHVTAIGQTVVDDINVQGKLVGTDGVFTGTVDFENVNVTGELLASEISGEYLYGTVIEGGEIRTGGDESRGSFHLGDRAYVSPVDGYAAPGLQLRAPDREYVYPAGLGIDAGAVSVSSGRTADGRYGQLQVNRGGVSAVVSPAPDDSLQWGSRISSDNKSVRLSAGQPAVQDGAEMLVSGPVISGGQEVSDAVVRLRIAHNGRSSLIQAINGTTTVESSDGTTTRALKVDGSGVWATEGSTSVSLIPQVRQFQYSALWNADLSPSPIMVQHLPGGKLCQAQIRIQNLTGSSLSLPNATWVTLNYNPIPSDLRGGFTDYIEVTLPQNEARGRVEMNYSTGSIRIRNISGTDIAWTNNNSIWFPMCWFSPN